MKSVVRGLTLVAVNVLLTATLLELGLQAICLAATRTSNPWLWRTYARLFVEDGWEESFLRRYLTGSEPLYVGIHQPHATRGWAMKPSAKSSPTSDTTYTTNAQGYRALYDYRRDPDKYGVLIVGDSFTFGDEVDDTATWPHLLQARAPRLNVFNMGGTGYGTDQMLITLEEEIDRYRPRLVVCAIIGDDLRRSMLAFRDYAKPRFVLQDGRLMLTNTPIGDVDAVVDAIASHRATFYSYSSLQTINLIHHLETTPPWRDACLRRCQDLNRALLDRMHAIATRAGAEFLFLYLPWGDEFAAGRAKTGDEAFFERYVDERKVHALNLKPALLSAPFVKAAVHYGRNENDVVSAAVLRRVEALDSWQQWTSVQAR